MEKEGGKLLIKHSCLLVQCPALRCTGDREDFSCALGEAIAWVLPWVRATITRLQRNKAKELCLQFLPQNSISALGAVEEKGKGCCRHKERDTSWNVVGFTKHKKEHINHQEASLNCKKKEEPSLSRPRSICNTFNKGSQSVGMEQHWGCQARCVLLHRLWLSSCSPAKWGRARWVHWSGDFVYTGIFLCRVKRSRDTQNPQT